MTELAQAMLWSQDGRGHIFGDEDVTWAEDAPAYGHCFVYSREYDVSFLGIENLHPFDSCKWGKVAKMLQEDGTFGVVLPSLAKVRKEGSVWEPLSGDHALSHVRALHSDEYVDSLKHSSTVADITEMWPLRLLPHFLLDKGLLGPMACQAAGTVLATRVCKESGKGWAVNIGGGFHHAHSGGGGGFCVWADVGMAALIALDPTFGDYGVVGIMDLDAHQGNGHARHVGHMKDQVVIADVYNSKIYPRDKEAAKFIDIPIKVKSRCEDTQYLGAVQSAMAQLVCKMKEKVEDRESQRMLVLYVAGTDILEGDPLGRMDISIEGVLDRDEIVFKNCRRHNIDVVMVTAGGYQSSNSHVIYASLKNLQHKGLLPCK
eukprot:Clim_evm1s217 gene=Clim_evmTU1s217